MVSRILLCYSGLVYWFQDEVSAQSFSLHHNNVCVNYTRVSQVHG